MSQDGVLCVSRNVQYLHLGTLDGQSRGKTGATELRHNNICDHQVDRTLEFVSVSSGYVVLEAENGQHALKIPLSMKPISSAIRWSRKVNT